MIVPALLPEIEDTGQLLYRSDITHGKNKKSFELLPEAGGDEGHQIEKPLTCNF
jgi:hypothetical protein